MNKLTYIIFFLLFIGVFPELSYAQTLGEGTDISVPWGRLILGLMVCCLLAFLIILVIKSRYSSGPSFLTKLANSQSFQNVNVKEVRRLSPDSFVCLIEYRETEFLAIIANGNIQVLREHSVGSDD